MKKKQSKKNMDFKNREEKIIKMIDKDFDKYDDVFQALAKGAKDEEE